MPQMSPMYWTLLLIYSLFMMYLYISMLYFTPISSLPQFKSPIKKSYSIFKKLKF